MTRKLSLSARLLAVAGRVRRNSPTADVGTDHGYLPAFLVISGKTDSVCASDIVSGPLVNAAKTLERYNVADRVKLIKCGGLELIPHDIRDIVIAGMGGTLIVDILSDGAAAWIKRGDIHLVLQPMTHCEDVREYLLSNGFFIESEDYCVDDGRVYVIIGAHYDGIVRSTDKLYCYFGKSFDDGSTAAGMYIKKQLKLLKARRDGLSASGDREQSDKFAEIIFLAERTLEGQTKKTGRRDCYD